MRWCCPSKPDQIVVQISDLSSSITVTYPPSASLSLHGKNVSEWKF